MAERPTLLFYCQHAVGLGHLVRSLTLAEALAATFDVVLLNGGRMPDGTTIPTGVRVVNLPPLGHDSSFNLISHDPSGRSTRRCANDPGSSSTSSPPRIPPWC